MQRLKSFFNKTTIMCLLLGACLAVLLAIFISRDKSISTPMQSDNSTQTAEEALASAENDMTDVIGYDLYGTHMISSDKQNEMDKEKLTFNEDGTASGYIGKDIGEVEAVKWSVVMNDGILCVNFTNAGKDIQYEFSYDDDMNIVLSSDNETLTLTKV